MLFTLLTAPMCQGCHAVAEVMREIGLPFQEIDIRTLTEEEIVDVLVALRITEWPDKLIFGEVDGDVKPILQAPILTDGHGALWPGFLLPDGKTPDRAFLEALIRPPPPPVY